MRLDFRSSFPAILVLPDFLQLRLKPFGRAEYSWADKFCVHELSIFYLLNGDGLTLSEFHAFVETRAFKRSRKWILGFLFVALQQYGTHSILLYETDWTFTNDSLMKLV